MTRRCNAPFASLFTPNRPPGTARRTSMRRAFFAPSGPNFAPGNHPAAAPAAQNHPQIMRKTARKPRKTARKRRKTSQKTPKNEPPKIAPLPSVATLSKVRVKDPASGRRGIILTPYSSLLYDERKHNMGHGTPLRVHPWRWREGWRLCFTQTIP